ncbi:Phospholipase A-2-activating protein [Mycena kentingensis (nom. inval.)]|nr:Phospholipase A-2-activating protein [Mycena kentingensis (nom. inval.)]
MSLNVSCLALFTPFVPALRHTYVAPIANVPDTEGAGGDAESVYRALVGLGNVVAHIRPKRRVVSPSHALPALHPLVVSSPPDTSSRPPSHAHTVPHVGSERGRAPGVKRPIAERARSLLSPYHPSYSLSNVFPASPSPRAAQRTIHYPQPYDSAAYRPRAPAPQSDGTTPSLPR